MLSRNWLQCLCLLALSLTLTSETAWGQYQRASKNQKNKKAKIAKKDESRKPVAAFLPFNNLQFHQQVVPSPVFLQPSTLQNRKLISDQYGYSFYNNKKPIPASYGVAQSGYKEAYARSYDGQRTAMIIDRDKRGYVSDVIYTIQPVPMDGQNQRGYFLPDNKMMAFNPGTNTLDDEKPLVATPIPAGTAHWDYKNQAHSQCINVCTHTGNASTGDWGASCTYKCSTVDIQICNSSPVRKISEEQKSKVAGVHMRSMSKQLKHVRGKFRRDSTNHLPEHLPQAVCNTLKSELRTDPVDNRVPAAAQGSDSTSREAK